MFTQRSAQAHPQYSMEGGRLPAGFRWGGGGEVACRLLSSAALRSRAGSRPAGGTSLRGCVAGACHPCWPRRLLLPARGAPPPPPVEHRRRWGLRSVVGALAGLLRPLAWSPGSASRGQRVGVSSLQGRQTARNSFDAQLNYVQQEPWKKGGRWMRKCQSSAAELTGGGAAFGC